MSNLYLFKTKIKHKAYLYFGGKKIKCFIGGAGIGKKVREGDMITPRGVFKLLEVFYRSDRVSSFHTNLPKRRLKKTSMWCVHSQSPFYNSYIEGFKTFKCEKLFRDDSLYDIFINLNYNIYPTKKFRGSAIFIHCCNSKTKFTEGCVAFRKKHIIELLKFIRPTSKLIIY